jgi:invasion protein IalB
MPPSRSVPIGLAALMLGLIVPGIGRAQQQPDKAPPPASIAASAWRVECTGDGKTLECRGALQQLAEAQDQQLVAAPHRARVPTEPRRSR